MSDTCRSCHQPVLFVPSAKSGKPLILNAEPEKRVVLIDRQHNSVAPAAEHERLRLHDRLAAAVVNAYTDHHATCPKAGQWKGRTRAEVNRVNALHADGDHEAAQEADR